MGDLVVVGIVLFYIIVFKVVIFFGGFFLLGCIFFDVIFCCWDKFVCGLICFCLFVVFLVCCIVLICGIWFWVNVVGGVFCIIFG